MSYCHRLILFCLALVTLWTFYGPSPASVAAATATSGPGEVVPPEAGHVIPQPQAGCQTSITVTTTADSGAGSLRQALADVCSGGTVNFAAGLHDQTITLTTAELSITKTVTITNPNAANLKVSGNNARRVFNIQAGAVVTISSLSVISGTNYYGGDIYNDGTLTINNSTISGGSSFDGGGIHNYFDGRLILNNSRISNNSVSSYSGGIANYGTMLINNSTLSNNIASRKGGGLINSGILTVSYSTFISNSVTQISTDGGGGIYNIGTLLINSSTFNSNSASLGGGMSIFDGSVIINSSTFNNNFTNFDGSGGGIFHLYGSLVINNSTFSGNWATTSSGGILSVAPLTLTNSTFSNNSATSFGNIYLRGTGIHLRNNVVANNLGGGDCYFDPSYGGTIATNLNNLVEDGSCNASFSGDPNLGPLQNNGGSTFTHALLSGSLAIDRGDNGSCLGTDQRGFSRPIDGNGDAIGVCDIGAFEALASPSLSPDLAVLGNNTFIPDGKSIPSLNDHTDFGTISVIAGPVTRTFAISNSGTLNLYPSITITGDESDFTLVVPPTTPVIPGSSTTFQVRFTPFAAGLRTATINIFSNDPDENPYDFAIQGNASCVPSITVTNNQDTGVGALRHALAGVCDGGTVNFASILANQTIGLTSAELSITKTVTIANPNALNLKVSGNNALRVFNIQAGAVVTINNLSIISGTATNGGNICYSDSHCGSGILNSGTLTLNNIYLSGNLAAGGSSGYGGGIANEGVLTVQNSTLAGNIASYEGGGIFNTGVIVVNNSTFSDNVSRYEGGGIANNLGATLTVNNSTFNHNSATDPSLGRGGNIENVGTLHLRNSILANSPSGQDCFSGSTISTNLHNLVEDGSCNPALSGDPNLGPLQNNGGATPTHALLVPSPALDAGDNATCLTTDQRGITRPLDGNGDGVITCDIGAVESPTGSPSPNMQVWGNNTLIPDGDITPSPADHTDFGTVPLIGGAFTRTFTISNTGVSTLFLTGSPLITITGDIADFSVVLSPATSISPGSSTTFQVRFDPTTSGIHNASLIIANNDLDGNPYDFKIQGTGLCVPAITVINSADNGLGTLRQALSDICSTGTIDFSSGLTNQTISLTSGELSITKTMIITNPNAFNLKVSGNNAYRVFSIQAGIVVTMSRFSIISGTAPGSSGGGILNYGTLRISDMTLSGNTASFSGAGIYNDGILTTNNVVVTGNSANYGGGLHNDNILTVNNSIFSANTTRGWEGGGIYNSYDAVLTVNNGTFNNNSASSAGGGIYLGGTATINNSIFSGNSASSNGGGGIYNLGDLTVNNSIFSGNSVWGDGGGIYNTFTLTVNNSTFNNNSSLGGGGGILNDSTATINNSTFSDNSTRYGSNGLSTGTSGSDLTIINNSTFSGGGLSQGYVGTMHLRNNIIANSNNGDCYNGGTIAININNLIEDGNCNPALSGDPLLGPLANNGGSTLTHALLPGSPAINAGNNATCLATDQRGIARPQQGQCDIGAFESRGFTLTRSSGNNQSTPIGMTFSAPLVVSVSSSTGEPVSGGVITLTGPGSGAGTSPVSTTAIISGTTASASVTANAVVGGPYNVAASSKGASAVNFSLTNLKGTPLVTVTSSLNPSTVGQSVTLAATVYDTVGTPSGNVTFVIDGVPQAPVALVGGQASLITSSLTTGNHTVSANYGGDTNFNTGSGSLAGGQTVNPADAPTIQFTQAVYTATENIGISQNIILTRTGSLTNSSQVQVSLSGGTATAGSDYSSAGFPKTVVFGSGVISQTVPLTITDDGVVEPTETISLTVTPLTNAVIGLQNSAVLQIQDNDVAPAPESKVYLPLVIK